MMNRRQPRYSIGQRIGGRFLVHQALLGGMGEVYLCLDEQVFEPVALKTFQGSSADLRDIFKREVANWIALEKHPNIVRCFWMETFDNIPFMALEWVAGDVSRGTDLRSWMRHSPLELPLALRFTIDIVRGLQHANAKVPGIVHRDLKLDNVLVNESKQAKITDFGLAMVAQIAKLGVDVPDDEGKLGHSRFVGNVVGTPPYMPPEQWRGETDLDFRTDLYAVGCMLYELLTGKWPYTGHTVSELKAQHLDAPLPSLDGNFPPALKSILDGCLAKKRDDRYDRLDLLLTVLQQAYNAQGGERLLEVSAEDFTIIDYNNRGITFAKLGQYERALADFYTTLRLDPAYAQAYNNRGLSYAQIGQHEQAIADFDTALRLDPSNAPAYNNRGNSYAELGQHERAIAEFDAALRLDPAYAHAYMNRGNSYYALGQHNRAITDFDAALRLDPTYAQAFNSRGNSYAQMGQHEQALADFDTALSLDPTDAQAYYNRGLSYAEMGHHERALADFDAALRFNPNYAWAYNNRGNSYATLGQHERAIADFDAALRLDPASAQAYYNRGNSYADLGQHEQALADFNTALSLDPTYAQAYNSRGSSYAGLGQRKQALADFDAALRLDPTDAQAYYNRGSSYDALGQYEQAIADFDTALRLDPTDTWSYNNRGNSYAKLGQHEQAIADFDTALRLDPTDTWSYNNRGNSYAKMGQHEQALADFDTALRLDPSYASAWLNKGVILVNTGRLQEALSCFERSAQLGDPRGAPYTAQVQRMLGRSTPPNEQEQVILQLLEIYRQHGEAGLRQVLQQNGVPVAQANEIIVVTKRIAGGA